MMFLQYAVWGAWLPVLARYLSASAEEGGLGFSGSEIGMIIGLGGSVGALSAPFIAGQLTDRYFSSERFLAVLLLVGGIIQWLTALQVTYAGWLWFSIAYSVVFMPTLALSNSLAFAHLRDKEHDFPRVRVWGSIGWIAASWIFPMIWLQSGLTFQWMPPFLAGPEGPNVTARLVDGLKFSAIISIAYAAFCLVLPHTPAMREGVQPLAFAKAFGLFRNRSFTVLVAASLPISVIHQIYFMQTAPFLASLGLSDSRIGPVMSIAQFGEIGVMVLLGRLLSRLGFRWVFLVGALAFSLRYLVFATQGLPLEVIIVSQVLNGFSFVCFFAASFIYVDQLADSDIRHSAQTVFGIVILGGGPAIAGWLSGFLQELFTVGSIFDFSKFWYTLSAIGLATGLCLLILFRDERPHLRDS